VSRLVDLEALLALPAVVSELRAEVVQLRAEVAALKTPPSDDDWISITEAAPLLPTTVAALRKKIRRGKIPHRKVGRAVLVQRRAVVGR
jgi:excisionase family DNA binding protein